MKKESNVDEQELTFPCRGGTCKENHWIVCGIYTMCVYEDCIQTALKHLKAQIFKEIKHGFTINNENDLNNKISPKDA